jgi:hypothetical protein
MSDLYVTGMPGVSAERLVSFKRVFRGYAEEWLSGGKQIDGVNSRDPTNIGNPNVLQPGLLMGKISATGLYAPSILGVTGGALATGGTSLTLVSAAVGAEIVRRRGGTGTLKIIGPPAANGVARSSTATYSAIVGSVATITGLGGNETQQINFNIASTGGAVTLEVPKANGQMITTTAASWNATDATYLASIQAVLDVATGVAGGIVVSAIPATDTDLGFILTYSGTGYAGLTQPTASVLVLPTSSTTWTIARTNTGGSGAFVTGSLIGAGDGSENPLTFIGEVDGGILVTDSAGNSLVVPYHRLPVAGEVDGAQLIPWSADTGIQTWIMNQLSTASGGKFVFGNIY